MSRLLSLRKLLRHAFAIAPGRTTKNARNPLRRCLELEALEDRLAPAGDILVTGSLPNVGNVFQEYTSTGSLVRTVPVPPPPNDSFTYVESIAQDANGNVYVWDGRSTLALAIYNAQSGNWSQLTYPQGWSTGYQSGQTGVAVYGHYAYVSNETGPSGQPTVGVIRFDLDTGIGTDFNPFNSGTVSVAMGLDGNFYALGYNTVYELDPNTMALENTVNLPSESYIGLAVDAAGDLYLASSDGTIDSFDPSGTPIATTTLAGNPASIAIASDGTLAVGTRNDGVARMTTAFTNITTFNVADGGDDVAFAQVAPPGPASPAQSIITLSSGTIQAGTMTALVTLTAKDANGYRETSGGLTVEFGLAAGAAQGSFTTATDHGDGTYTATLTGLAPGATTITATMDGQAVTSTLPGLTITPSTPTGDILTTVNPQSGPPVVEELTQAGALVQSIRIPPVPGDQNPGGAGVTADAQGNIYVTDGGSVKDIAINNPVTGDWTALSSGAFGGGDISVDGNYLYTAASSGGILRFDLTTGVGTDFNSENAQLSDATIGLDGNLYAFDSSNVMEIDLTTLAVKQVIELPYTNYTGLAVNASGDIFATEYGANVDEFSPAGVMINKAQVPSSVGQLQSIAIGPDGTIVAGGGGGHDALMTGALTDITAFPGGTFVGFAQAAPPGPASPAQSIITCSDATLQAGTMTATVTLTSRDANGLRVNNGGLSVQFGLGAGAAQGVFTALTDNGDGTYSALFTATTPGTNTITATINGQPVTSSPPSVTVTPSTPSGDILVTTAPNSTPVYEEITQAGVVATSVPVPLVSAGSMAGVGAVAEDSSGKIYVFNGVLNHDIAVYHPTTGSWSSLNYLGWGNGNYGLAIDGNYAYTGNSTNQSGAASGGIVRFELTTGQATRFNSYGVDLYAATIGLDGNLYALGGIGSDTVYVINPVTMALERTVGLPYDDFWGIAVNASGDIFAAEWGGTVDHFSPTGQLLDTITLANGVGNLYSIAIGSDGTLAVGTRSSNVVLMSSAFTNATEIAGGNYVAFAAQSAPPGPASLAQSVVTVSPATISLNGTATITLQARDANGTAETTGGLTVGFHLGAGPAIGSIGSVTDNNNGTYTATFTAGTLAGVNTITATINGQAVTSTPPSVTVAPGPYSLAQSTVSIAPASVPAGGTAIVTLQAKDAYGNNESTGGLAAAFALGNGVGSGTFGSVNDHGNGAYTAVFTGTTIGANTITATINTQAVTSTPSITVTPGALSPSLSTISIAPNTLPAGTAATITLTLLDAGGNPFTASASIVFAVTGVTGGSFSGATNVGSGVYTATFTGTTVGTGTLGATINNIPLTSVLPSVTVTPLALDHFKVAAGNSTVTVTAQDIYNNAAPTFTGSVHLASVNNKSAPIDYTYAPGTDAGQHQFNLATSAGVDVTNLSNFAGATPANVAVQANINLTAGQYAGLVTRYGGPTDKSFYFGGIIPNPNGHGFVAAIWVNKTGKLTALTALVPMTSAQGTLYFETVGTSLQLFWRPASTGTLTLLTAVNDASLSGGTVGVRIGQGVTVSDVLATAVSSSPASFTFGENFVAGSYPTTFNAGLSSSWQDQAGVVSVVNSAAVGRLPLNVATLNGINTANEYAQAVVNVQRGQSAGLVVRYQGTGNHDLYYGAIVSSGTKFDAEIGITLNGVSKLLTAATPLSGGGQGTLLFVAVGSSLQLFWQPTGVTGFSLVASATNASLLTGSVGMRISAGATLTSFKADVAPPPSPQNATLTFTEDFTNPNYPAGLGSQLSGYWQNQLGDVSIVNANAVGQTSLNVATLNGVNIADVTVQATVNVPHGKFFGLASRYAGAGDRNMYFAEISSSGSGYVASIWINVNGVWTRLTPLTSIGNVGQGTLQFKTIGSSLQLFWNGTLIVSATNTRLTTGSVGMRIAQGVALANFSAG